MKTIKDAAIEHNGIWPHNDDGMIYHVGNSVVKAQYCGINPDKKHIFDDGGVWVWVGTRQEFESEAKRLGYINGYRWGVEYPTNGKRPDLADDVWVELRYSEGGIWFDKTVGDSRWLVGGVVSFRITDPRYKPVDELVKEGIDLCDKIEEKLTEIDNNWRERGVWPHSGCECELWHGGEFRKNIEFLCVRGMDIVFWDLSCNKPDYQPMPHYYIKPIRTEREKVIEAAYDKWLKCAAGAKETFGILYDA